MHLVVNKQSFEHKTSLDEKFTIFPIIQIYQCMKHNDDIICKITLPYLLTPLKCSTEKLQIEKAGYCFTFPL